MDESRPQLVSYGSDSSGDDNRISNQCGSNCVQSPKRLKLQQDEQEPKNVDSETFQQQFNGCHATNDDMNGIRNGYLGGPEHHERLEDIASDSESTDANKSTLRTEDIKSQLSDATVFRYCIEGISERSMLLHRLSLTMPDQEIVKFADQISLYTGCSHHKYQIMLAKKLCQEGSDLWNSISRNNGYAFWMEAVPEIERKFLEISGATRGLSQQDVEVLHRIAGCGDCIRRENLEQMWNWLYPVALTISKEQISKLWECTSPKWIEGIITKEEAENSLVSLKGLLEPGTFVIRFPTSRSWPHPDAGSLIVTYVGSDYVIHNRLLAFHERNVSSRPLQDMLLEEPELSHLASITRQATHN